MTIGENALSEFLNTLIDWERVCIKHLKNNVPIDQLSRAKQEEFDNDTHCHICRKPFEGDQDPKGPKVRDHDYVPDGSLPLLISNVISSGRSITRSLFSSTTFADSTFT